MKNYLTIRQVAAAGIVSESYLRLMVAQGRCPGIRVGNRYMVNVPLLMEQMDRESQLCGRVEPEVKVR